MARVDVSTTVDGRVLAEARKAPIGVKDAALLDEALQVPLDRHCAGEVDACDAAYDDLPIDDPDEWGDLASFRAAAAAT